MTTPSSLLVGDAKGWHDGDRQITFSFITAVPGYYAKVDTDADGSPDSYLIAEGDEGEADTTIPIASPVALSAAERALALKALSAWSDVADLNLVAVAPGKGVADITLAATAFPAQGDEALFGFVADFPGTLGKPSPHGDFWLNTDNPDQSNAEYGNTGWQTFLHELGHGLGLHHPDEDPDNEARDPRNSNQFTVMSYEPHPSEATLTDPARDWPLTPMLYDIAAIQSLYGANLGTRAGNTTYFGQSAGAAYALKNGGLLGNGHTAILTIWDAGGIDTIDASNQTGTVRIDLNPGAFSTIGKFADNIAIALAHKVDGIVVDLIENAIGGSATDILTGNRGANLLDGRRGADTMRGGLGNDTYGVDNARDVVIEAANQGRDTIVSTVSYVLGAGQQVETLQLAKSTGTAALGLTGNALANTLFGNAGANVLDGKAGADALRGGRGNDTYVVDNARDAVIEAAHQGRDTIVSSVSYALGAGQEVETLQFARSTGVANLDLTGNALANVLYGNAGANRLDGGAGADLLTGRGGNDSFLFSKALGGGNVDHITDFTLDSDAIRLSKSVFTDLGTGTLAETAFKDLAEGRIDANDRILYNRTSGSLSYDSDGSGTAKAVQFAILDNKAELLHFDVFVV